MQKKVSATRLLENTIMNMRRAINKDGQKIILYSGHDTTIYSLLVAMQFTDLECVCANFFNNTPNSDKCINKYPPFASNFVFELWQEDNKSYSVQVLVL